MLTSTSKNSHAMDSYSPVCGSTKEIDRGIRILSKKKKNLEMRRNQLRACAIAALIQQFELPLDLVCGAIEDKRQPRIRSEEHTSELQSLMRISYAVFCLKKQTLKLKHKD